MNVRIRESGMGLSPGTEIHDLRIVGWQFRMRANWRAVYECQCGRRGVARVQQIVHGGVSSCGCRKRKWAKEHLWKASVTHGESKTPLHEKWRGMVRRCYEPNLEAYKHYGARGIRVCDEWHTYEPFREWSRENGYSDGLTIDRIDPNGDYCPENCQWVSLLENVERMHKHYGHLMSDEIIDDVMRLTDEGLTNKQIAATLGTSVSNVDKAKRKARVSR